MKFEWESKKTIREACFTIGWGGIGLTYFGLKYSFDFGVMWMRSENHDV